MRVQDGGLQLSNTAEVVTVLSGSYVRPGKESYASQKHSVRDIEKLERVHLKQYGNKRGQLLLEDAWRKPL